MTDHVMGSDSAVPLRVMHVIQHLGLGGAEQSMCDLLSAMAARQDVEPSLVTLFPAGARGQALRDSGIEVHEMGKRSGWDPFVLVRLVRLIRARKPDVVHSRTFSGSIYGRGGALLAGGCVVAHTEDSAGAPSGHHGRMEPLVRFLGSRTDITIAFSSEARQSLLAHRWAPADRVFEIPNGVPPITAGPDSRGAARATLDLGEDEFVIMAVGRLNRQKRYDRLIDIARAVGQAVERSSDPSPVFVVVGGGSEEASLRKHIADTGVTNVRLLGNRDDARHLLCAADILLNTSDWESMPIAMLEAMSLGVPVVAPRLGSIPSMLEDGGGVMLDAPIAVEAATKELIRLISDPERRRALGAQGKAAVASRFAVDVVAEEHVRLYREAIAAAPLRRRR